MEDNASVEETRQRANRREAELRAAAERCEELLGIETKGDDAA